MMLRKRIFDGVDIECLPTGSAIYGTTEVPSDLDYICLDYDGLHTKLCSAGWVGFEASGQGKFQSLRKGFINLILGEREFVTRWIQAHQYLLDHPEEAGTKELRVAVFERFSAGMDLTNETQREP